MTQRTRSHRLEEASEREFRSIAPETWLPRRVSPDYGVDLQVEIFDEAGRATGLLFGVQLKATDGTRRALRTTISLKVETLEYWRTLPMPILLVRYDTSSGNQYFKWAHVVPLNEKTVSPAGRVKVEFYDHEIASQQLCARISEEVRALQELRTRGIAGPLPVNLTCSFSGTQYPQESRMRHKIRQAIENSRILRVAQSQESVVCSVDVTGTNTRIALPTDLATVSIDTSAYRVEPMIFEKIITSDVMVAFGLLLARINSTSDAAELAEPHLGSSVLASDLEVALHLSWAFVREGRADACIPIASQLLSSDSATSRIVGRFWLRAALDVPRLFQGGSHSEGLANELENSLLACAKFDLAAGRNALAGDAWYTLARVRGTRSNFDAAIEAMDNAARHEPKFLDSAIFHRQLGGSYYEAGMIANAIPCYERAVRLGGCDEATPLLGDVLMRAGRYSEAYAVLESSNFVELTSCTVQARINRYILDVILAVTGIGTQQRQTLGTKDLKERIATTTNLDSQLLAALREIDALDPRLWVQIAGRQDDDVRTFDALLTAAAVALHIPDAWALATVAAIDAGVDAAILSDVIDMGYRFCDQDFLDAVDTLASEQDQQKADKILMAVYERVSVTDVHRGGRPQFQHAMAGLDSRSDLPPTESTSD